MTTIVTRTGKGSPLTHAELDTNFTNLNTNKLETAAIPLGTLAAPSISFLSDANTGIYSPAADTLAFVTAGSNRVHITSGGLVGIGTSNVNAGSKLHIARNTGGDSGTVRLSGNDGAGDGGAAIVFADNETVKWTVFTRRFSSANKLYISTAEGDTAASKVTITEGGLVGIGTTGPTKALEVAAGGTSGNGILVTGSSSPQILLTANSSVSLSMQTDGSAGYFGTATNHPLNFRTNNQDRAQIDTSGRLLIGTSTARSNFYGTAAASAALQIEGQGGTGDSRRLAIISSDNFSTAGGNLVLAFQRSGAVGGNTIVQSGDLVGTVSYLGNEGTNFVTAASFQAEVDGTVGANRMPGRLVFSTATNASPSVLTERMRIDNAGSLIYGTSTSPGADIVSGTGFYYQISTGLLYVRSNASPVAAFNRGADDGTIVEFKQDQTTEGTISVSGTTVSYNGAHLSRWSQLPTGAERTEILRGSVLSNIDEMCEWGDEENEQLNRMKVSTVQGDKNVSGVFQCWDDDDDTYINDFYCAMTGDFIIRIAEGVTVERGDLLMSAGDGTAKPQDDDIIRSKTVAKVTSTNVSCTYEDGSYCVPCVLMAC